jgi:hypothetical protein
MQVRSTDSGRPGPDLAAIEWRAEAGPDPERLDNFIATQLSSDTRSKISRRLR